MRLAGSIQRKLLPRGPPRLEGWDVAGAVLPALATCGDYFDFITVRDDQLCLVVGDACGHGVGPAVICRRIDSSTAVGLRPQRALPTRSAST